MGVCLGGKARGVHAFFDLQASSDQQPASVVTISGTQLKLGDRVLAKLSHYRSGSRQGVQLLLDPNGKKLHCSGWHNFNPDLRINSTSKPESVKLEVRELLSDSNAAEKSKQIYEFRPLNRRHVSCQLDKSPFKMFLLTFWAADQRFEILLHDFVGSTAISASQLYWQAVRTVHMSVSSFHTHFKAAYSYPGEHKACVVTAEAKAVDQSVP